MAAAEEPTVVDDSGTLPAAMPTPLDSLAAGTVVGRYVVIDAIGVGGMGAVYRAYDPQLHREIALKRLRSRAVQDGTARLIKEARAMARLSDPHVVAVYDVVVEGSHVTLAMEHIEGGTLADWLGKPRRADEVLARLVEAGRGLAAAHRAGLVHRDFKPGNVLVPPDGPAKVTDFGLVKTGRDADPISHETSGPVRPSPAGSPSISPEDSRELTRHGTVLGTPRYAAPEQFLLPQGGGSGGGTEFMSLSGRTGDLASGQVDARSDQFAFCVSAWRALTGHFPFKGDEDALQEAKLAGPPPLPKSVDVPPRVARALHRGLSPDPGARWPSMDALLAELQPETSGRSRWILGGLVALAVTGIALASARTASPCADLDTLQQLWSADRRQQIAAQLEATGAPYASIAWDTVEESIDTWVTQWRSQRRDACQAVHVRGEQTPAQMDLRVGCLQQARARLQATLEILDNADTSVVEHASNLVGDLPALDECADVEALARDQTGAESPLDAEALAALRADHARAAAVLSAGRYAEAADLAAAVWESAAPLSQHPLRARIGRTYAMALAESGKPEEALPIFREVLHVALAANADELAASAALSAVPALLATGQHRDEAQWLAELGAAFADRPDTPAPFRARAAAMLGEVEAATGDWDAALAHDREALQLRIDAFGEDHPDVAAARNNLGLLLYHLDRAAEAVDPLRAALHTYRTHRGDDHPEVANAHNSLAMALQRAGRDEEALDEYEAALEIRRATLGEMHANTIAARYNVGLAMSALGRSAEAEAKIREALRQWAEVLPPDHPYLPLAEDALANTLLDLGRIDDSVAEHRKAVALGKTAYGEDHPQMCGLYVNYTDALRAAGQDEEARAILGRALPLCERELGSDHRFTRSAREQLDALK